MDAEGKYYIADNALLAGGDCEQGYRGNRDYNLNEALGKLNKEVNNHYISKPYPRLSGKTARQFYSAGTSDVALPSGSVTVKIFRGPEYKVNISTVNISVNSVVEHKVELKRWANMPEKGWYSSDAHLHVARSVKELNPYVSKMMQAEDINVANLLVFGTWDFFGMSPQYAYGPDGEYREGNYILATGQENPRTNAFFGQGHAITLGASDTFHDPENYVIYRLLWEKAARQGGLSGYAHWGAGGGEFAMPVLAPHGLMNFVEVMSFNHSDYTTWYDALNLGFRVTPVAGTDYPCGNADIPGTERFYTRVEGEFSYKNWLQAVEKGQTFVTTGPLVDFTINGKDIGGAITLDSEGEVLLEGNARFDTDTDHLAGLEVVENGEVIYSIPNTGTNGEIGFKIKHKAKKSSWLAVRGYSTFRVFDTVWREHGSRISAVHSAPIYITIKDSPFSNNAKTQAVARTWLARLDDLEKRIQVMDVNNLTNSTPILKRLVAKNTLSKTVLDKNRQDLLREIKTARKFYLDLLH